MLITCLILGLTIVIARDQRGTTLAAELRIISVGCSAFTTVFHKTEFLVEQNIFLNGFARQEQNSSLGLAAIIIPTLIPADEREDDIDNRNQYPPSAMVGVMHPSHSHSIRRKEERHPYNNADYTCSQSAIYQGCQKVKDEKSKAKPPILRAACTTRERRILRKTGLYRL